MPAPLRKKAHGTPAGTRNPSQNALFFACTDHLIGVRQTENFGLRESQDDTMASVQPPPLLPGYTGYQVNCYAV